MSDYIQGKVLKLFITQDNKEKVRQKMTDVTADENGIVDDKFYSKNDQRAILIASSKSYHIANEHDIELQTGSLGENILIDIDPYHLNAGETLTIGNTILEITQNCTLCKGLSSVNTKLPKLLKNDRGIFAKVISGDGNISVGDVVIIPLH